MKGLAGVLDRFSEGLKTRKILPSLLEEVCDAVLPFVNNAHRPAQMKDSQLLPSILPNVFAISNSLTPAQFASTVLPSLKLLFSIKEPPQNMLTLLDNLDLLQGKTDKAVFKDRKLRVLSFPRRLMILRRRAPARVQRSRVRTRRRPGARAGRDPRAM